MGFTYVNGYGEEQYISRIRLIGRGDWAEVDICALLQVICHAEKDFGDWNLF
jgi:hypothetical protein